METGLTSFNGARLVAVCGEMAVRKIHVNTYTHEGEIVGHTREPPVRAYNDGVGHARARVHVCVRVRVRAREGENPSRMQARRIVVRQIERDEEERGSLQIPL